jgi:hypothetical protein
MNKAGLLAACVGAVLLALSTHLGGVTGFVGTAVWAAPGWRLANVIGWLLLIGGFFLQYLSVRRSSGSSTHPLETDALLNVLDYRGVIKKAEVLEEIARVRGRAAKAH